jgi:hypothetical protein
MIAASHQILLIQCQLKILALESTLASGGVVEHKASWLKNRGAVFRDSAGRFASEGRAIGQGVGEIGSITADFIGNLMKDEAFRERAGLVAGKASAEAAVFLAEKSGKFPSLEANLIRMVAEAENRLGELYGDDQNPVAQAMRKTSLPQPPKDASFREKLEFQAARYKAFEEAIENPEKFNLKKAQREELAAKAMKAAVPVAIALACAAFPAAIDVVWAMSAVGAEMAVATEGTPVAVAFISKIVAGAVAISIADASYASIIAAKDRLLEKIGVKGPTPKAITDVGLWLLISKGGIAKGLKNPASFLMADFANIHRAIQEKTEKDAEKSVKKVVKSL